MPPLTGLLQGDALRLPLRTGSVDLVVSSPPYFGKRDYGTGGSVGAEPTPIDYVRALWAALDELWRVTAPTASVWINLGDKRGGGGGHNNAETRYGTAPAAGQFTSDVRRTSLTGLPWRFAMGLIAPAAYRTPFENTPECWHDEPPGRCFVCRPTFPQWIGKAEVIWLKTNAHPEPVKNRVQDRHEPWFHLVKDSRYIATVDRIREPTQDRRYMSWEDRLARGDAKRLGSQRGTYGGGLAPNPLGKVPGSVRAVATESLRPPAEFDVRHEAAFPAEWPRWIIDGWSHPGAVVLDPFTGTGTVPMMARVMGRVGIGLDLSAAYLRLARWRVFDSDHGRRALDKARGVLTPEPVVPVAVESVALRLDL